MVFDSDLQGLINLRTTYQNNPLIAYLNINSLQEKIISLKELLKKVNLDVLCIDETKLDSSFPDQFKIKGYQFPPLRRDHNSKGGGKMVFIKEGFIAKQIKNFETISAETICLELTINKRKWCILFAYRPPNTNKDDFFSEISISLNKIIDKYDIVLAGDLNIDDLRSYSESSQNHLPDMKDVFSLTNLIKEPTCFKSQNGTLLDLILTTRPRSFMKSLSFEAGLSDCHKLVCSILRASFKKLKTVNLTPKIVKYRDHKHFYQEKFLHDLNSKILQGDLFRNCEEPHEKLSEIFIDILNFHALLKQKQVRGNQAPFMTKELSKAIMVYKIKSSK